MKTAKKMLAFLLAASMVISLTACAGNQNSSAGASSAGGASSAASGSVSADLSTVDGWAAAVKAGSNGKSINLLMSTHTSTTAIKKMIPEFTKLTGITVNLKEESEDQLKNDELLDFSSKAGNYDVYMVDRFWLDEYKAKGVMTALDDDLNDASKTPSWFDFNDFVSAYKDGLGKVGDSYYGVPLSGETRLVGYRTDLFQKYNKQPPKTMDDLLSLAKFFNGKESGLYGIAMRAQKGIMFASGWMSVMYNFCDGFVDQATNKSLMTNADTVKSLEFYTDLLKNAPPDVSTYTHEEAVGAFASGKTAMWLDATSLISMITDQSSSKVYDKVAFVPTPTGPKGDAAALAGWTLGIPATAKSPNEAWNFIMYITSKSMAKEFYSNGGAVNRTSIYQDPELSSKDKTFAAQLSALDAANGLVKRNLSWIPPTDKSDQILDIVGGYGSQVLTGNMTAQQACEQSDKEVKDLLG